MSAQVADGTPKLLKPRPRRLQGLDPAPLPRVLLRRADAQPRAEWLGVEEWRGLSLRGRTQAESLVARLADLRVRRVLASPSLRCRQTVVPLARTLDIDVEICPELSHRAPLDRLRALLEDEATEGAVFCTHRGVLGRLFTELSGDAGSPIPDTVPPAASWTLVGGRSVAPVSLVPLG
jgi:phosphohistidine phosphatase SixA